MQPLSGNQRQDRRTCLTHVSLVTVPATRNASLQVLFKCPTSANDFETATKPSVLLTFGKVQDPLRLPHKTTLQRPKMVRACGAFSMFTSKCASRHNVVHFFQHFNFRKRSGAEVLWAYSLRRALFERLNFQKCSDTEVFFTFWVPNVLRTTTAVWLLNLFWLLILRDWLQRCVRLFPYT